MKNKKKKSEGVAIVLSILLSGAGHMYAGKVGKGFALLFMQIVLYLAFPLLALITWVWIIFDSVKEVKGGYEKK